MGILGIFVKKEDTNKDLTISIKSQRKAPKSRTFDTEMSEIQKKLNKQDDLIRKRNQAEDKFKQDGNVNELLSFWRGVWADKSWRIMSGNWIFNFPELLIKEKLYDEAWGVLNKLYLERHDSAARIRDLQYKVLKSEGKHPKDAIYYLMASILLGMDGVVNPIKFYKDYEKDKFIKKAKPLAKKAGFSENELEYLAYLIENSVSENQFSENRLRDFYEKFLLERTDVSHLSEQ